MIYIHTNSTLSGILGTRSVPVDGTEKPMIDLGGLEDFGKFS